MPSLVSDVVDVRDVNDVEDVHDVSDVRSSPEIYLSKSIVNDGEDYFK